MIQLSGKSTRKAATRRYLILRFAIILLGLFLVFFYQMGLREDVKLEAIRAVYLTLGSYILVALVSLAVAPRLLDHSWFTRAQVAIDLGAGIALTAATGGVLSVFAPLLFISLFNASTVLRRREIFVFAAVATTGLAVVTLGHSTGILPVQTPRLRSMFERQQLALVSTYLIGVGVALHLVAFLGSQLAGGLWRASNLNSDLIENMGEGLLAVDDRGRVIHCNREARRLLQPQFDELNGLELTEIFSGDSARQLIERVTRPGEASCEELWWERPDGSKTPLELRLTPSHGEQGARPFRVALFRDLGLHKEVEEAERRIRQLEELYGMAMGIAHEIRNPLASIRGCVQEIGRLQATSETRGRLIEIVCKESDRLDQIIEDFLSFTRKRPRPACPVDLVEVARDFGLLLEQHESRGDRRIELELPDEPHRVLGDRERIQQVLLNLGLNALDATDPGEGRVTIRVFSEVGEGQAPWNGVSVRDDGEGISREDQEKIFTPFFTRKDRGTGLGLAIVQRFVRDHGGHVQLHSTPGEGTEFRVSFPATNQPIEETPGIEGAEEPRSRQPIPTT